MPEHCITMSADEVRALKDGKAMHRWPLTVRDILPNTRTVRWENQTPEELMLVCRLPKLGDVLVVRETHRQVSGPDWGEHQRGSPIEYRADGENPTGLSDIPWRSPIHMPKWAARYRLKITAVRVERLQEISDADALAEGWNGEGYPLHWFREHWNTRHPKTPWEQNPFVAAITFEAVGDVKETTT